MAQITPVTSLPPEPWYLRASHEEPTVWSDVFSTGKHVAELMRETGLARGTALEQVADGLGKTSSALSILQAGVEVRNIAVAVDKIVNKEDSTHKTRRDLAFGFFGFTYAWTESVQFLHSIGVAVGRALAPISIIGSVASIGCDTLALGVDVIELNKNIADEAKTTEQEELIKGQMAFRVTDILYRIVALSLWTLAIIAVVYVLKGSANPIPTPALLALTSTYLALKWLTYFSRKILDDQALQLKQAVLV